MQMQMLINFIFPCKVQMRLIYFKHKKSKTQFLKPNVKYAIWVATPEKTENSQERRSL